MSQATYQDTYRTTIEYEQSGDAWKAWEPESDNNLYGRGDSPAEAAKHYCELLLAGESDGV